VEIYLLPGKSGSVRTARHFRLREKNAWEGRMSETQGYKSDHEFTLPMGGAEITRTLFLQRLDTVEKVLADPESRRVFSRNDMTAMAFESLMLAKMIRRMPGGEARHA
jgi:hypothetical protein